jgi:tetratricopeptide (TPR) repeat protein
VRAFIVRPFGEKQGVDFDKVERELIAPALERLGIAGRTTGEVIEAGNIREDMFQLLLVADLVVADISIDNANAYYELGIRHALRQRRTFLLRAKGMGMEVPFDLRTDRYLAYDPAKPGDALGALCAALEATRASERQDSPVFRLLPDLREQSRSAFLPVPREFREELEYAVRQHMRGKLALLGDEAAGAVWECEGFRLVGREEFRAKMFEGAAVTLERIRAIDPDDPEANLLLGTVYERLGDLPKSEIALRRVTANVNASKKERAEAWSLLGRNLKTRWREEWQPLELPARRARALESPLLMQACDAYSRGFREDLNHFYPGLNALALLTIATELITALPDQWIDQHETPAQAEQERQALDERRRTLAGAVELSIDSAVESESESQADPWVHVSVADLRLLTGRRTGAVSKAFREALAGQPSFVTDSVRTQLKLYASLDLLREPVARVLSELPAESATPPAAAKPRTILFTGHQMDAPDRKEPRFPPEKEGLARAAIRDAVMREAAGPGGALGLAGAASGGDILFHEVCQELGVPTLLYLALPPDLYVAESVAPAAGNWVRRFYAILEKFEKPPVLAGSKTLPGWLRHRAGYSIWQRNNLWMLNEALSAGARHLTVLALWNGKRGDGPGGTADMIATARARGADTVVIDTNTIF